MYACKVRRHPDLQISRIAISTSPILSFSLDRQFSVSQQRHACKRMVIDAVYCEEGGGGRAARPHLVEAMLCRMSTASCRIFSLCCRCRSIILARSKSSSDSASRMPGTNVATFANNSSCTRSAFVHVRFNERARGRSADGKRTHACMHVGLRSPRRHGVPGPGIAGYVCSRCWRLWVMLLVRASECGWGACLCTPCMHYRGREVEVSGRQARMHVTEQP